MIYNIRSLYPDVQIRFNVAVVKGKTDNQESISKILDFAEDVKGSVKFIELYPSSADDFVPLSNISEILKNNHFRQINQNPRQLIFKNGNQMSAILTRITCASAMASDNPEG